MIARILFWCKMALQQGRYWWINDKKLSLSRHVLTSRETVHQVKGKYCGSLLLVDGSDWQIQVELERKL